MTVDGQWGAWEEWSECSATCKGGFRMRNRQCDSPKPKCGGAACSDDGSSGMDTEPCNEDKECSSTTAPVPSTSMYIRTLFVNMYIHELNMKRP